MPNQKESDVDTQHILRTVETDSIYMERAGKGSRTLTEKLLAPPEHPLSPDELDAAIAYEQEICEAPVSDTLTLETLIRGYKSDTPTFFADSFLKGHVQLPGLEGQFRQFQAANDVYAWLAKSAKDKTISLANFRELARQSAAYYKTEMTQALLKDERPTDALLDSMSIAIDPEKSVEIARAGQQARQYLMAERKALKNPTNSMDGAKRSLVDIYTKRINGLVTSDMFVMDHLTRQSHLIGDSETLDRVDDVFPDNIRDSFRNLREKPRLNKRIDYLRNGIGYSISGEPSSVDAAVFDDAGVSEELVEAGPPVFNLEQKERLKETMLDRETIHDIFKQIIRDANLLSAEDESSWSPARGHRAHDNLFQVVYQPIKDTLTVESRDGVLLTPNASRSVYDILTVGAHELTHINQAQADQALGNTFRIGHLKGRRVSMLRESGANIVQRQIENELFGTSKPIAFAYARAIQSFESGGDIFDASRAFYQEKLKVANTVGSAAIAKEAADRALRPMSFHGSSSQSMSYAEEAIMNAELADASPEVRQRATSITTLDLDDQLRLHTFGMLPEIPDSSIDWTQILMQRLLPYIESALAGEVADSKTGASNAMIETESRT